MQLSLKILEHLVPQLVGMGKGMVMQTTTFLLFRWSSVQNFIKICAKFYQDRNTPASTIFNFFKFPKPPRACLQQFLKVSSQQDERCVLLYGTHQVLQLVQFSNVLNFQNHCKHVYNFLKFNCNRMNDVCTQKSNIGYSSQYNF